MLVQLSRVGVPRYNDDNHDNHDNHDNDAKLVVQLGFEADKKISKIGVSQLLFLSLENITVAPQRRT
eukprot:3707848-Pyramimonas_sp.AAC.1